MKVKGSAFIGSKSYVIHKYGEEVWEDFMYGLKNKEPYFEKQILTSTFIDIDKFLFFIDEYLKNFYRDVPDPFWMIGREHAKWALTKGPYKILFEKRNLTRFINFSLRSLWNVYYTAGEIDIKYDKDKGEITLHVFNLPVTHKYFETVPAFAFQALYMLSDKTVEVKKEKDIIADKEMLYKFYIK